MTEQPPRESEMGFFVASRGIETHHGLVRCSLEASAPPIYAKVKELSSIVWHPTISVIYGVAGRTGDGQVFAWAINGGASVELSALSVGAEEKEPCHLAVTPDGKILAVANYTSSEIVFWSLSATGSLEGSPQRIHLKGSGPDLSRQEKAHPHQVVFSETKTSIRMFVPDLGTDTLREYELSGGGPPTLIVEDRATFRLPPGTGPRHMIALPDGRIALSGELASTLIILSPSTGEFTVTKSTARTGSKMTGSPRNYPGDLRASPDGAIVYLANRGYDTIAMFDVTGREPKMISELDPGLAWPQHIHVTSRSLVVAGLDSSRVASFNLIRGMPQELIWEVEVSNPAWLLFAPDSAPASHCKGDTNVDQI